jgi:hypothetical protein
MGAVVVMARRGVKAVKAVTEVPLDRARREAEMLNLMVDAVVVIW